MKTNESYPQHQPTRVSSKGRPATLLNFWIAYKLVAWTGLSAHSRSNLGLLRQIAKRQKLRAADLLDGVGAAMWAWWRILFAATVLIGILAVTAASLDPGPAHDVLLAGTGIMVVASGLAVPECVLLYYRLRSLTKQVIARGDYPVDLRSPSRGVPRPYDFWVAAVIGVAAMVLVNWSSSG